MVQAVLNHLWQSTLLVAALGLAAWLLRNHRAGVRYWLWFAASLKFLLPFSLLIALGSHFSWHSPASTVVAPLLTRVAAPFPADLALPPIGFDAAPTNPTPAAPPAKPHVEAAAIWLALWACGSTGVLGVWLARWLRIRQAIRYSLPLSISAPITVKASPTA